MLRPSAVSRRIASGVASMMCPAGALCWQLRCRVLCEALRALSYLHGLTPQVVHRDVKPSNILLEADDHARLADIGMAKAATVSYTHLTLPTIHLV